MLAACPVRIVEHEDIPGPCSGSVVLQEYSHAAWKGAKLYSKREPLCDHLPVAVTERRRIVHGIAHHRRVSAAHNDERHFICRRCEGILDHLEGNGVECSG